MLKYFAVTAIALMSVAAAHAQSSLVQQGHAVADRACNACHLKGTIEAPSFAALAKRGTVTEAGLGDALGHGHEMSPITLLPEERRALAAYINSLK